jgi:hypothetical protein
MTPGFHANAKMRLALISVLAGGSLIAIGGCDPRQALFFLQPNNPMIEAPFKEGGDSLEGKKIVVLCQVATNSMGEYSSLDRDLTREFSAILRKKVKKITVIDPDKVMTWKEAHPKWTAPAEIATDFNADVVIFLEVEQFQTESSADVNMLHGQSKVHIVAYEMQYPKNSKDRLIKDQPKEPVSIYDDYAETTFPETPLPIDTGSSRSKFRIKFLKVVAKEVSWHFIEHAADDSIQDSRIER